jgi:hypothetical protein
VGKPKRFTRRWCIRHQLEHDVVDGCPGCILEDEAGANPSVVRAMTSRGELTGPKTIRSGDS